MYLFINTLINFLLNTLRCRKLSVRNHLSTYRRSQFYEIKQIFTKYLKHDSYRATCLTFITRSNLPNKLMRQIFTVPILQMLKWSLRDIHWPKTKSWQMAEPESHTQAAPLNVCLHRWNPLMVLSIFSHGCLHSRHDEGFPCRRKTSGKSNPSLFLLPQWCHSSQVAWKTSAFLSHTENLCVWLGAVAERRPPIGGEGKMCRQLRGTQGRPGHTSAHHLGASSRSVTLDVWWDSVGLCFLRWKEEVISPSSLGRFCRGAGGEGGCPVIGDQAGREEIMWGNHGPGNGLAWNLRPSER